MYLHDEITLMYARVSAAFDSETKGVVYTGMPTCGKSVGLFYMLLSRMATGVPVMFSSSTGKSFVFDDAGVWSAETARSTMRQSIHIERSARMWSLIDHPVPCVGHPHPGLLNVALLFPVHAVRFEGQRFLSWATNAYALQFHMDPWESTEIIRCLRLNTAFRRLEPSVGESLEREDAMANVVARSGPTPADALQEILEPGRTEESLRRALHDVNVTDLAALRSHVISHHVPNELADMLLLWRRRNPPQPGLSDLVEPRFKSELAFKLLYERLCQLNLPRLSGASMDDKPQLILRTAVC
ncbi:hypothetical protein AURDEDRAFT_141985 [Auricularia subglabra TFB-10046 SS5]|nr:hypothetical protein AURDEDRAFT_141985 [Auricularia subglabra TFB-10046 SS5]